MNVILAQLLQERGLVAAPEEILRQPTKELRLPDVVIDFQGLRLVIEAEFGVQRKEAAWEKACGRVEEGIAHIGVAVVYPARLKRVGFQRLRHELQECRLQYAVFTEVNEPGIQKLLFKLEDEEKARPSFATGSIDDLGNAIRRSYEILVKDETLDKVVELLGTIIDAFMGALEGQPATTDRLREALGIEDVPENNPRARRAVNRIAGLILANAMIFQEVLSKGDARVLPLQRFRGDADIISSMADHWGFILKKINYYPIFKSAFDLIRCLSSDEILRRTYANLLGSAMDIVRCKASLRHDLAGRIYHRLLEEAKYLGAYYTAIPSATLLLKLAMGSPDNGNGSGEPPAVPDMRIADLACGTGTLLMAACDALMDRYVRQCVEAGAQPELGKFHSALVEKMIYGYDVLPSAIHLTASTLALRVPEMPVNVTHLYSLALGGDGLHLGTLDLLEERAVGGTLFGLSEQITGKGRKRGLSVGIPDLDLCVMNPPFTRSVGGNLLFGSVPEEERGEMQRRLKAVVRRMRVRANITAGLGSVFVALGDRHVKPGGRIALVLPRALVSGVAWRQTRDLLNDKYHLEYVIVSHDPEHWNFSENTNLSEVLVVARKKVGEAETGKRRTRFVSLWRQPRNAIEALGVASSIMSENGNDDEQDVRRLNVELAGAKVGEGIECEYASVVSDTWGPFCAFAQAELVLTLLGMMEGTLRLPTFADEFTLPLCKVGDLGEIGFDRRDLHDGFSVGQSRTVYPAIWGHDASRIKQIQQSPNAWLNPLEKAKNGRPLRQAAHLWKKSSKLIIAERLRLNTMRANCVLVDERVLSNVWWSLCLSGALEKRDGAAEALALWFNSSLGILLTLGSRVETEGAWIDLKKPLLEELAVLDVRRIRKSKLKKLREAFNKFSGEELMPFSQIGSDRVRARIDETIAEALGLPDLGVLRKLLSQEPILCLSNSGLVVE